MNGVSLKILYYTNQCNGHELEQIPGYGEGQGSAGVLYTVCVVAKNWTRLGD